MTSASQPWFEVGNVAGIPSPALLLYPDRIEENVRRMLALVDDPARLRPHLKTHKLPELVRMQRQRGITRFKTATIAETEMAAACGVEDILLAYPPVGPNVARLLRLGQRFPGTKFSTIVDDERALRELSAIFAAANATIDVLLDIDCGMRRTGVPPDARAVELYQLLSGLPGLNPMGLHAYDGHIHDTDLALRQERCDEAFRAVEALQRRLWGAGLNAPRLVMGGTPTYPMHARRPGVECSPGTCVLWDAGYAAKLPDLDFLPAALVLTRVVSKPGPGRLCLDLGHKAVASENPHPRVSLLGLPDARAVSHSEEHLVIETGGAEQYPTGSCLYGIPWHVCPTVALHAEAVIIRNHLAQGSWKVVARERAVTV